MFQVKHAYFKHFSKLLMRNHGIFFYGAVTFTKLLLCVLLLVSNKIEYDI